MSPKRLTPRDELLATTLASGTSIVHAAEQHSLHERTVRTKLADPTFRARVGALKSEIVASAVARLASNMTRAADTLAALLDSSNERVRLHAAQAVFGLGFRGREGEELQERVAELLSRLDRLEREKTGNRK